MSAFEQKSFTFRVLARWPAAKLHLSKADGFGFNVPMLQNVPLFIGLRYIRAKRRNQFISFVSGFSLLGMLLGVTALVVVLSVMNGLDRDIKVSILKAVAHGFVDQEGGLKQWEATAEIVEQQPHVVATAPYIQDFAFLSDAYQEHPLQIQGILPQREVNVSEVDDNMVAGRFDNLIDGDFGIVLGDDVANFFGVDLGDKIKITTLKYSASLVGVHLRGRNFTVVGIFDVGQKNQEYAYIHVADVQRLLRYGDKVQGLHVQTDDMYTAPQTMQGVAQSLDPSYRVLDWSQTQGDLFQAIKMEKRVIFIMLSIIIAIAAFNIVSSLVLMVADKRADIAVLRTMGLTGRHIMQIFMIQGSAVGMIGLGIGLLLGRVGAAYIGNIIAGVEQLFGGSLYDPTIYYIKTIPSFWQWSDSITIAVVAIVLSVSASLYPAYQASKIEPAEALRYE